jgi:oligopeptide transport system permease protein
VINDNKKFEIIGCINENSEGFVRPSITYWQDAWRRLKKNKIAMAALVMLIVIILMCIFGPLMSPYKDFQQNADLLNKSPFGNHYFGTDNLGRDIFVRIWTGGRVSIEIGLLAAIIEMIVGTVYGGICGYLGGVVDDVLMRIVEVINGIPYMIVVILVSLVLNKGVGSLIIALCITAWTGIARVVRGQVLQLKESEYVLAAKTLGAGPSRLIFKHLIPNTLGVMIVYMTFDIPAFMFSEAFLSFVGLGVQPPKTSWGAMCSLGQSLMSFYPYQLFFPAIAISLTMLSFNLLGDGLRDALDPKLRQ